MVHAVGLHLRDPYAAKQTVMQRLQARNDYKLRIAIKPMHKR